MDLSAIVKSFGGLKKAAEAFGEPNYQTVQDWVKKNRVPASKVKAIHKRTQIPLKFLNADLYE